MHWLKTYSPTTDLTIQKGESKKDSPFCILFLQFSYQYQYSLTVNSKRYISLFIHILFVVMSSEIKAQSLSFDAKSSPDLDFTFNSIQKYINGITVAHALELNINAIGSEWDLYIGATTTAAGSFNVINSYSNTGTTPPPVSLIQARIYDSNNTPISGSGFFPLTDIATPTYIIGSSSNDAAVNCGDAVPTGTNTPGSYLTDPECYKFKVDLKLVPGLTYRPGLYTLRIDFIIIEDL
jgi:hypothetical protein